MSWTDEEIDNLFGDGSKDLTFEYKKEYWKDIEAQLPIKKKRDFLWVGTSLLFLAGISAMFLRGTSVDNDLLVAGNQPEEVYREEVINFAMADMSNHTGVETMTSVTTISSVLANKSTVNEFNEENVTQAPLLESVENNSIVSETLESQNEAINETNEDIAVDQNTKLNALTASTIQHSGAELNLVDHSIKMPPRNPYVHFYIQGIAGVSQGKMIPGQGLNAIYGLGAGVEINKGRLFASFALNGLVSNQNTLELTRQSKVYGFGAQLHHSTVKYSRLFTLENELTAGYRLNKTVLFAGVNMNYIVNAKSTISMQTNDAFTGQSEHEEERSTYGYTEGLRRFNVKPVLGAAYDLRNNLQLGMTMGVQLMNTVNEDYFTGTMRAYPLDGRIYLRMKL